MLVAFTETGFSGLLKLIAIVLVLATPTAPLAGVVEITAGAVISGIPAESV
jgi:hypothetical protein